MLLFLIAPVFAAATETGGPDRLEGVHVGVGVGMGWYTQTSISDGESYSYAAVSSYTSLRLRLGKRWAIEPSVRLYRSGSTESEDGSPVIVSEHSDGYSLGVRVRPLIASVDRIDFVGALGAWHTRQWWRQVTDDPGDEEDAARETAFLATTSAEVGVALEYWIMPRLSVSAEVGTNVYSASVYKREPELTVDKASQIAFSPCGDAVFHLYF